MEEKSSARATPDPTSDTNGTKPDTMRRTTGRRDMSPVSTPHLYKKVMEKSEQLGFYVSLPSLRFAFATPDLNPDYCFKRLTFPHSKPINERYSRAARLIIPPGHKNIRHSTIEMTKMDKFCPIMQFPTKIIGKLRRCRLQYKFTPVRFAFYTPDLSAQISRHQQLISIP